jgi:hypothetical protein
MTRQIHVGERSVSQVDSTLAALYDLGNLYRLTKRFVVGEGFAHELDWQARKNIVQLDESMFLEEAAWVILSSGMKESLVRRRFGEVSAAFHHWKSADVISRTEDVCRSRALLAFNHSGKIDAICAVARRVTEHGFSDVADSIRIGGVEYLRSFPFIGKITSFHLAKNIGLNVAKPDRHLCRIASTVGFDRVQDMCEAIAYLSGDSVSVVDVVLWRFATLNNAYVEWFEGS